MSELADHRLSTEELLERLQASPTDLGKLVKSMLRRGCPVAQVQAAAVRRWLRDDPENWRLVRAWLTSRGTKIVLV